MDFKYWIEVILLLGGMGGFGGVYKYYNSMKSALESDRANCEKSNTELKENIQQLEHRIIISESKTDSGFPEWKKDSEGRFIWCNGEFVRHYLSPYGKNFSHIANKKNDEIDFFSDELVKTLDELDILARVYPFATKWGVLFHEKSAPSVIIKRVVTTYGTDYIYYHGIAVPINESYHAKAS